MSGDRFEVPTSKRLKLITYPVVAKGLGLSKRSGENSCLEVVVMVFPK
jgi:hypothetical protein